MSQQKILGAEQLRTLRERYPGKKIVLCHGVFDVLHAGHLAYFNSAKEYGDILVVTITADEFVNKGPGRPYFNAAVRARMIAALEVIDVVAISRFPTAVELLNQVRPDFYVKGPDYKNKEADPTGAIYQEEGAVQKWGGQLVFTDDETFSSSELINKFFTPWSDEQVKAMDAIKAVGGFSKIEEILEKLSKQTVRIIGEPIVDTYVFCHPESISSKSPSVSAKFLYEENYAGGALAIANHLADFVKDVSLLTTHGGEPYFQDVLENSLDRRVALRDQKLANVPTPRKTRFIAADKSQRIFELTDLRADQWLNHSSREFCDLIQKTNSKDALTILADFGHGIFEKEIVDYTTKIDGFIGLNVQTNSSNFGFNPFTKHKRFSFLSLDIKEARIAYHDRFSAPLDLARRIQSDLAKTTGASFGMTLGSSGAYFFPSGKTIEHKCPAFADTVVDATGAGDAFFAMASMLTKANCPDVMVPFLANVFAGIKTKIIGNKFSITRAQFIKAITAILK